MEFAKLHCGNKQCKKILGHIPTDNMPLKTLEVYCEGCMEQLEDQDELNNAKPDKVA